MENIDKLEKVAAMFKTLGDSTRLRIFEYLRTCSGPVTIDSVGNVRRASGPTVGEICCHINGTDKVTSTVSFHLKELRHAGIITMKKHGKNVMYSINPEAAPVLASFLLQSDSSDLGECCE